MNESPSPKKKDQILRDSSEVSSFSLKLNTLNSLHTNFQRVDDEINWKVSKAYIEDLFKKIEELLK
jgi:hypothetical protein